MIRWFVLNKVTFLCRPVHCIGFFRFYFDANAKMRSDTRRRRRSKRSKRRRMVHSNNVPMLGPGRNKRKCPSNDGHRRKDETIFPPPCLIKVSLQWRPSTSYHRHRRIIRTNHRSHSKNSRLLELRGQRSPEEAGMGSYWIQAICVRCVCLVERVVQWGINSIVQTSDRSIKMTKTVRREMKNGQPRNQFKLDSIHSHIESNFFTASPSIDDFVVVTIPAG